MLNTRSPGALPANPKMPGNYQKLLDLQRTRFDVLSALQSRVLYFQVCLTAAVCSAVLIEHSLYVYAITVAALLGASIWAYWAWRLRSGRLHAERARRATLLMAGMDESIASEELQDICERLAEATHKTPQATPPDYFDLRLPAGPPRVARLIEESAFWSYNLLRFSARQTWALFTVSLFIAILLLLVSMPILRTDQLMGLAKVVCSILALLVSNDLLGMALSYSEASKAAERVRLRAKYLRTTGCPQTDLILLFADYGSVVEFAPLFAPGVYNRHKTRLESEWKSN